MGEQEPGQAERRCRCPKKPHGKADCPRHGQMLCASFPWDWVGGKGSRSGMSIAMAGGRGPVIVYEEEEKKKWLRTCVRKGMLEEIGNDMGL